MRRLGESSLGSAVAPAVGASMENLPFGVSGETGGCSGNGSLKVTGSNVDTPPGIVHHGITPEV
jgi:hypothetical protein